MCNLETNPENSMAKTDSTKVMWRVQTRNASNTKWKNRGLYETRDEARYVASMLRLYPDMGSVSLIYFGLGYGMRNTRVIRHIRGEKK